MTGRTDAMKAEQNAVSKKIPAMKKAGEDTAPVFAEMKRLAGEIKEEEAKLAEVEEAQKDRML